MIKLDALVVSIYYKITVSTKGVSIIARTAVILSVNLCSKPTIIKGPHNTEIKTGLVKKPVPGRVPVGKSGLESDVRVNTAVHGGVNKALYLLPKKSLDALSAWASRKGLDVKITPGILGENLTIEGIDERNVYEGDRFEVVSSSGEPRGVILTVTTPREPCATANALIPGVSPWMIATAECGFYCSVKIAKEYKNGGAFIQAGDKLVKLRRRSIRRAFCDSTGGGKKRRKNK